MVIGAKTETYPREIDFFVHRALGGPLVVGWPRLCVLQPWDTVLDCRDSLLPANGGRVPQLGAGDFHSYNLLGETANGLAPFLGRYLASRQELHQP